MSVQWINSDVELAELVLALGDWQAGRGPLQHRLAGRLREAVARGDLPTGARLPPERIAAERLGVSRGTLAAAYRLLCDEGSLEQRQGSGTRVTARQGADVRASHAGAALQKSATLTGLSARGDGPVVDLTAAILHGPTGLPASVVQSIGADILEAGSAAGYYPLGYEPLREALAAYLTQRGTPTRPEQVLVTTGAQQAISLAAAHLLQPGDVALIEDPTYPGAIGALGAAGARLVGVPSGRLGVDVQRLGELAHQHAARMVYVIPSFQNPTGGVLPEAGRRAMARLAEAQRLPIVEDETLAELPLGREPPPSIASLAPDAPIWLVGSLSKLFWGGLRVGWIRGREEDIAALGRLKAAIDLGCAVPSQLLALRLLEQVDRVRAVRRQEMAARLEHAEQLLARYLPGWTWERPRGGVCLWVRLPAGSAQELSLVARRYGVAMVAGPTMSPSNGFDDYVRLPYAIEESALAEGIRRLAEAWASYAPSAGRSRGQLTLVV